MAIPATTKVKDTEQEHQQNTGHWMPGVERRGLGNVVMGVNHIAMIVSDVGRSTYFYTDVLGLQQIQRPNYDRHGAWLTAGNVEIHLIKGTPLVHTGQNLIVSHIALDVQDPQLAFERLKELQVSFEINVSVPKGKGKAESEGGSADNTLSQAFIRDPDGYYIEICNCQVLTDFALGNSTGVIVDLNTNEECFQEPYVASKGCSWGMLYCMSQLIVLARRAKHTVKQRKACQSWFLELDDCTGTDVEEEGGVDEDILANFIARTFVYGDICQSFELEELEAILKKSGNCCKTATLRLMAEIHKGNKKRVFQPPAYYVEHYQEQLSGGCETKRFLPEKFEAIHRRSTLTTIMTAGLQTIPLANAAETEHRRLPQLLRKSMAAARASKRVSANLATELTALEYLYKQDEVEEHKV